MDSSEISSVSREKKRKIVLLSIGIIFVVLLVLSIIFFMHKKSDSISSFTSEQDTPGLAVMNVASISTLEELRPVAMIKDSSGNLIVSDFGSNQVLIYNSDLKLTKSIGEKGDGPAQFNMPHAVDIGPEGNLYVTDYGNKRIQIFSKAGDFIKFLETPKPFGGPANAYFDGEYNLYVSDFGSNSLMKFDRNGEFTGWIGAKSDGTMTDGWEMIGEPAQSAKPGGFYKLHSAKVDNGTIYVADCWNHRIERFSKEGKFTGWIGAKSDGTMTDGWEMIGEPAKSAELRGFNSPIAIDFTEAGEMAILEYGNSRVQLFSKEGKLLGWYGAIAGGAVTDGWAKNGLPREGTGLGEINFPYDMRIYGRNMYIADTSNRRIQIIKFAENKKEIQK